MYFKHKDFIRIFAKRNTESHMKRMIKRYLMKRLTGHPKNYHLLRWMAEWVKEEAETEYVLREISYFLQNERIDIPYEDIFVVGNNVYIVTQRPGLWIGKGGNTVNSLIKKINCDIQGNVHSDYHVNFIEPDSATHYIMTVQSTSFRK